MSSCLTNLLEFLEYVTSAVEQNKPVDVIYLDFQKTFSKVPHARLLLKLEAHGIDGSILQEGQHPLTGQRAANFRLLANQ